jgi:hypothetical protein
MIPCQGIGSIVTVSREWAEKPPPGWTRAKTNSRLRPGRPPAEGNGIFLIGKPILRCGTIALLRGDPLLRFEDDDISPAFAYIIKFMTEDDHIGKSIISSNNNRIV